MKLGSVAAVNEDSPDKALAGSSRHELSEEPISAFDLPPLSQTDESDTDDDEEVMAGLIAASQALQRMPNDDSVLYGDSVREGADERLLKEQESSTESGTEEDEEEPPPDPFGMPPLSQWKRSSRR